MGISPSLARAFLQEHRHKPIKGNVVLIGRQTMGMTPAEARRMCAEEGVAVRPDLVDSDMIDTFTRAATGKGWISDYGFFSLFTDAKILSIDVTDYEGADVIHDMHHPIPASMEGIADFLWIGSCLDNMCDPITALQNSIKMLKPGGRLVDMEIGVPQANAYLIFSPAMLFDFFAINKFDDCRIYVGMFDPAQMHGGPWHFYSMADFRATVEQLPMKRLPERIVIVTYLVAERGANTTWDQKPVQGQYRPDDTPYREAFSLWAASPRPLLKTHRRHMLPHRINRLLPKSLRSMPEIRGFRYLGEL